MEFGIVESRKDELMIRIFDDLHLGDKSEEGYVLILKKANAIKLAKAILKEAKV